MCIFFTMCEITFLVGGPWKSNVVLEKSLKISLKNGCNFLYEPCKSPLAVDARVAQNVFAELAP